MMRPRRSSNAFLGLVRRLPALTWLPLTGAFYAAGGGGVTLAGWLFGVSRLTDWHQNGITMKANAALCAILAGAALAALVLASQSKRLVRWPALMVSLVAAMTLAEHATGLDFGIDTLFFDEPAGMPATSAPGRMGPPASIAFTLLGVAQMLASGSARAREWGTRVATGATCVAALPVLGYLYGANQLYALPRFTGIALQTATMIAALGIGTIAAVSEQGILALLRRDDPGGSVFRRLALPITLFPIALGWVRVRGQELGLYDAPFGTATRTLIEMITLVGLLWWAANGLSRDSERVRALLRARRSDDEKLRESEALLRTVTLQARVGLVLLDAERRYLFANATYSEMLGLGGSDITGKRVEEVLGPLYDQARPRLDRAFSGESVRYELHQPKHAATGREHFYDVSYEPRAKDGAAPQVLVTLLDISERKRAELALGESSRRKDEFLATLAHELRNPLAPIRNGLEILRRNPRAPDGGERIRAMMERQLDQLVHLVDDLLDLSRVSRGTIALRKGPVDLGSVLESATQTCRPLIEALRHELVLTLPAEPIIFEGDATRLTQIFANLLNNAAKFTDPPGHIWISAERRGSDAIVGVRDDGIGIPADMHASIFESFTQLDKSIARSRGGLGIGLNLVKRLVEMHGGSVAVNSPPAAEGREGPPLTKGTEFVVRLPLSSEPRAAVSTPPSAEAKLSPRRLRILVADDNVDAAESLMLLLEHSGNEVRLAHDGEEALTAAEAFRPEVALLDIGMPKLDGFEVARKLRAAPWGTRLQLVALTGWGQPDDVRRSAEAGFDDHLVKPVNIERLEKILSTRAGA